MDVSTGWMKGEMAEQEVPLYYFLIVDHSRLDDSLIAAAQRQHNVWPAAVVSRTCVTRPRCPVVLAARPGRNLLLPRERRE